MEGPAADSIGPCRAPRREWEVWEDERLLRSLERHWDRWPVARNRRKLARRLAVISSRDPAARTLLDFGCGTCAYYPLVSRQGLEYKGADRTPLMLAHARVKFPQLDIYEDDLLDPRTPDRSFDIVMCNDVLVHLPDPLPALRTLDRIARRWVLLKVCLTTKRLPDWLERHSPPPPSFSCRTEYGAIRHFYNLAELHSLIESELSPRSVRIDTFLRVTPPSYWPGRLPIWEGIFSIEKN